jgi:hypothetical protein
MGVEAHGGAGVEGLYARSDYIAVYAQAASGSGATGLLATTDSTGTAVIASGGTGVDADTSLPAGYAVRGTHSGTGTAIFGTANSGAGVEGYTNSGTGVYGWTESSGAIGVYGRTGDPDSHAMVAEMSYNGAATGVALSATAHTGTAIFARAATSSGVIRAFNDGNGTAIQGIAQGGGTGIRGNIGSGTNGTAVEGNAGSNAGGNGVYAVNNAGTDSSTGSALKISGEIAVGPNSLTHGTGGFNFTHDKPNGSIRFSAASAFNNVFYLNNIYVKDTSVVLVTFAAASGSVPAHRIQTTSGASGVIELHFPAGHAFAAGDRINFVVINQK